MLIFRRSLSSQIQILKLVTAPIRSWHSRSAFSSAADALHPCIRVFPAFWSATGAFGLNAWPNVMRYPVENFDRALVTEVVDGHVAHVAGSRSRPKVTAVVQHALFIAWR